MDQIFSIQGIYSQSTVNGVMTTSCTLTYLNPGGDDVTMLYTGTDATDILPQVAVDVQNYLPAPSAFCQDAIAKGVENLQALRNLQRDLAKDQTQLGYIQSDLDTYNAKIADEQAQIDALEAQLNALVSPQPQ